MYILGARSSAPRYRIDVLPIHHGEEFHVQNTRRDHDALVDPFSAV